LVSNLLASQIGDFFLSHPVQEISNIKLSHIYTKDIILSTSTNKNTLRFADDKFIIDYLEDNL
jgi:hypothetical protein